MHSVSTASDAHSVSSEKRSRTENSSGHAQAKPPSTPTIISACKRSSPRGKAASTHSGTPAARASHSSGRFSRAPRRKGMKNASIRHW